MRKSLFVLLVLLLIGTVKAEDEYRIRTPTIHETVQLMTEIARQFGVGTGSLFNYSAVVPAMNALFLDRYDELVTINFNDLYTLYETAYIGTFYTARDEWGQILIHSWFNENQPDLNTVDQLTFADFIITVTPRDFNNDGTSEYLLDVSKGGTVDRTSAAYNTELVAYYVVQQLEEGYRFIEHTVPWGTIASGDWSNFGELKIMEVGFEDINDDNLPEWLVLTGGETFGGPGMGYTNTGQLYIMAWRDGQLVDLARDIEDDGYPYSVTTYGEDAGACRGPEPCDISWEFINADNDPAQEILQHQDYLDNWFCEIRETKLLDWNETLDVYRLQETTRQMAETRNCTHRQAEEAMWDGDYAVAVTLYEQAKTLPPAAPQQHLIDSERLDYVETNLNELQEYMNVRLALAYILTGRSAEANPLLKGILQQPFDVPLMENFAAVLTQNSTAPFRACLAAYELFTENYPDRLLGVVAEIYSPYHDYLPENIGCDAPSMIDTLISPYGYSPNETPLDLLQSLGLKVYHHLSVDFDYDSDEDWIVWLDRPMLTISFERTTVGYDVSYPSIDPYQQSGGVQLWQLPDDAGIGLTYFHNNNNPGQDIAPWYFVYNIFDGWGGSGTQCRDPENSLPVGLKIWRLNETQWTKALDTSICVATLEAAFPDGPGASELYGGEILDGNRYGEIETGSTAEPLIFDWNSETMQFLERGYIPADAPSVDIFPSEQPEYHSLWAAYSARDYQFIVENPENGLPQMDGELDENLSQDHYFRALALEALDRPDEALAAYIAIYESAPDSAWGRLAALHFEPVENTN